MPDEPCTASLREVSTLILQHIDRTAHPRSRSVPASSADPTPPRIARGYDEIGWKADGCALSDVVCAPVFDADCHNIQINLAAKRAAEGTGASSHFSATCLEPYTTMNNVNPKSSKAIASYPLLHIDILSSMRCIYLSLPESMHLIGAFIIVPPLFLPV